MIWKVYFWVMAVLIVLSVFAFLVVVKSSVQAVDFINLALMAAGMVGLYGFAFDKKIATKTTWEFVLVISLLYQFAYSFYLDPQYGGSPATTISGQTVTILPLLPMFIALYLYARRSTLPG